MNLMSLDRLKIINDNVLLTPLNDHQISKFYGGHKKIDLRTVCTERGCTIWNSYDMLPPGL